MFDAALRRSAAALALVAGLSSAAAAQAAPAASCRAEARTANLPPARLPEGRTISPEDLRHDFEHWLASMEALHPALAVRTDMAAYARTRARIAAALTRPMTERQAALLFGRLNPDLRDGHNGVVLADYRGKAQAHLDAGGTVFPLEVRFDPGGDLHAVSPSAGVAAGARIRAINGRPVDEIVRDMLAVAPGETVRFRQAWAARRFAILHWLLYGDTGRYAVGVGDHGPCGAQVVLDGRRTLPLSARPGAPAELFYGREVLAGDIGYLRVDSFDGEHRAAFAAFARQSFAEFRRRRIRALIIDVRDNPGGDDPPWQESLMEYVTTTPYAQVSRYAIRVTPRNADPGDVIGSIQRSEYKRRFTPSPENPDRFSGPVYILAGPYTYSAAIQFLVAAQDFGIAKVAGEETGALSCQTGQTNPIPLQRTGLAAFAPVIAFTRPSGVGCDRGVLPDVEIPLDETNPRAAVEALAAAIRKAAPAKP